MSARTLSYWEAGSFEPRVPELEAVLDTLAARPAERTRAFAVLSAPRGLRRWREQAPAPRAAARIGPAPSTGDLLRAMRHRKRMGQDALAAALGVSTATLSRWEQGKVVPPDERMDQLLSVLGARPEERAAVAQGPMLVHLAQDAPRSVEELRTRIATFSASIYECMEDPLHDLNFLILTAQAWPFAASAEGRRLLAEIHGRHAAYLAGFHRYREAEAYANRALDLMPDPRAPEPMMLRAAIVCAEAAAHRGPTLAPRRGLEVLEPWRAMPRSWPCYAWLLADMAVFLSMLGEGSAAIAGGEEACQVAEAGGNADDVRVRRLDLARIHTRFGRGEDGLSLTQPLNKDTPFRRADVNLLMAEEYLVAGERDRAETHARHAETDIRACGLLHLQPRLAAAWDALSAR